jgi:GNAT superfamily N-acetyltransferase
MSEQRPPSVQTSPAATEPGRAPPRSVCTESFPALLRELGASVMVTTYQAGKLVILRADNGTINTHCRGFNAPMGLALAGNRLAIGTALEIWEFHNAPAVADKLAPAGKHDACFLPRGSHFTGDIQVHEMAWGRAPLQIADCRLQIEKSGRSASSDNLQSAISNQQSPELWFVNTRFSCLCTRATRYSFVPRWQPPFITAIAPEDRCHLNGLAMEDGQPRAVTALAVSDKRDGWRPHQRDGGVVVDVPTGAIVCRGLSMPHSPRCHDGRLWLLNSGAGGFGALDPRTGGYEEVATLPGFTRGLDFHGRFAFIGLSQLPESALLSGLAIAERPMEQRACGVWVVDIVTGQTVAFVRFEEGVQEIFAVHVVAGRRFPDVLNDDRPRLADSFVLPDEPLNLVPEPYVRVAVATPLPEEPGPTWNPLVNPNGADHTAAPGQALLINNCATGATNLLLARSEGSEPMLALGAGDITGQGFVVRESGPHDLAHIRTWLPGQLRGTPAVQFLIAVEAGTGATAGVAALRVFADRGGRFDLFVPAVLRRRGCGTALLEGIRQSASRAGVTNLLSYRSFQVSADDADSKGARGFAQARGLPVAQEIVHCRAELKAALAVLEPLHRRFEARGPGGAGRVRYVMADEVDPRELAIFVVGHIGGFPEDVFERLREPGRGLLLSALVALVGTEIVGGIMVVMRRGLIFTDSLVVKPSHRGGGVDLGLMYRMGAAAELLGQRMLEFEHDVTNAIMAKLARRFGATQVGSRQCFACPLP